MERRIADIVREFRQADPPGGLLLATLRSLERERVMRARIRFGIPALIAAASLVSSVAAAASALSAFSASAFAQYASLAFSDGALALAYWQDLALSLVESTPFVPLILVVGALFAFLLAIRTMATNAPLARSLFSARALSA